MVIIINGKGGCGKDSLVASLSQKIDIDGIVHEVRNLSTIDKIKEIARAGGWDNDKSEKGRKLLSDLKRAFTAYNELPLKTVMEDVEWYSKDRVTEPIFFVHIREPGEIAKAVSAFRSVGQRTAALLVRRQSLQTVTYGNASDDNVEDSPYDCVFHNNIEGKDGELPQELVKDFANTVRDLYHITA